MGLLLQITTAATDTMAAGTTALPVEDTFSLWDLTLKGGPIMIPIALCSLIAVYIIIERYFAIRKASKNDPNFMNNIRDFISIGNITSARSLCKNTRSRGARVMERGV